MNEVNTIGARLDRLPVSRWHYKIMGLIGLGLFVDSCDSYMGGAILAELVKTGWSNNYLNATFVSATMAGLFFGSFFAGYIGDHFGRKFAYQINLLIFGASSLLAAFATDMYMLIVLRCIMGFGLGAELVVGFGSISEFIPARVRGKLSSVLSLLANFGPPVSALMGFLIIPAFGWRAMFFIGGVVALIVWGIRYSLPESPRWYASKGMFNKAEAIVASAEQAVEKEKGIKLLPVDTSILEERKVKEIPFISLFKGKLLRRTIVGSVLLIGMNTLLYTITNWIPTIFVQSGIEVSKSMAMMTLMMLGAPLGVFIQSRVVDRLPRRYMAVGLLLATSAMGYIYSLQRIEFLIIAFGLVLTILAYMYTCLACSVYVPELWPTEARIRGTGLTNAIGRLTAIFSPYGVAWILSNYGASAVFITLGGIMVILSAVIWFLGMETRFKSIEEISKETMDEGSPINNTMKMKVLH